MHTVWAPWRIEYIVGEKPPGCVFCLARTTNTELTLWVSEHVMVVMNKFPYVNGHLLVSPVRHVSSLSDLTMKEMALLTKTVEETIKILKKSMNPDGFNVGLNLGKVAGAGVEEHLHFHVVPRWFGDVNALTVFADVRVIPEHILATAEKLKPLFAQLDPSSWS